MINKRNIFRGLGFCAILWGVGIVAVNNQSSASCVPPSGFAGLLNRAFFAPTGTCAVQANPRLCQTVGSACNIPSTISPGSAKAGLCTQSVGGCVCRATSSPNGAQ